ncbi:hypothetical protein PR048_018079 [Dryococelus australis]|uniref:Uncharacterized protein n=1 Tax=Dryococelus australis TaxID=614101 RepID=A0ABQ9HBE5_9NEOP|nr:hypothetical protein PR048_018079 [Dryococelus australis]
MSFMCNTYSLTDIGIGPVTRTLDVTPDHNEALLRRLEISFAVTGTTTTIDSKPRPIPRRPTNSVSATCSAQRTSQARMNTRSRDQLLGHRVGALVSSNHRSAVWQLSYHALIGELGYDMLLASDGILLASVCGSKVIADWSGQIWAALNNEDLRTDEDETRWKWSSTGLQGAGERGDSIGNSPTSGVVRHDSHVRESGSDPAILPLRFYKLYEREGNLLVKIRNENDLEKTLSASNMASRIFKFAATGTYNETVTEIPKRSLTCGNKGIQIDIDLGHSRWIAGGVRNWADDTTPDYLDYVVILARKMTEVRKRKLTKKVKEHCDKPSLPRKGTAAEKYTIFQQQSGDVWAALNIEVVRAGRGKQEIPEKTHRPAASSGTILTCKNPGIAPPGIEPGSPRWESIHGNFPEALRQSSSFMIFLLLIQKKLIRVQEIITKGQRRAFVPTKSARDEYESIATRVVDRSGRCSEGDGKVDWCVRVAGGCGVSQGGGVQPCCVASAALGQSHCDSVAAARRTAAYIGPPADVMRRRATSHPPLGDLLPLIPLHFSYNP